MADANLGAVSENRTALGNRALWGLAPDTCAKTGGAYTRATRGGVS